MQRKFIFLIFGLFLLILLPVDGAPDCHSAEFADIGTPDYFNLECGKQDGLCPEDYGDWGTCNVNTVTGGKCDWPDVDCGQVIPDLMFVGFPATIEPNTAFTLDVQVNKCVFPNTVVLVRNYGSVAAPDYRIVDGKAIPGPTKVSFNNPANPDLVSPAGGGVSYQFLTYCADKPNYAVTANGITTPVVNLLGPKIPADCVAVQGNAYPVSAEALSNIDIQRIEYGIEKETSPGQYAAVDPATCLTCSGKCSVFDYKDFVPVQSPAQYAAQFDSTKCDNAGIRFSVTGYDSQNNFATKSVTCTIANANPGCPGCNFASQFLNLVVARVKIWT